MHQIIRTYFLCMSPRNLEYLDVLALLSFLAGNHLFSRCVLPCYPLLPEHLPSLGMFLVLFSLRNGRWRRERGKQHMSWVKKYRRRIPILPSEKERASERRGRRRQYILYWVLKKWGAGENRKKEEKRRNCLKSFFHTHHKQWLLLSQTKITVAPGCFLTILARQLYRDSRQNILTEFW